MAARLRPRSDQRAETDAMTRNTPTTCDLSNKGTGTRTGTDVAVVRTLVISQHEAVRQQLVTYLGRSPALDVRGTAFTPEAIVHARPSVLVLDLSRLGESGLRDALDAARLVNARVIALASLCDPADERAIVDFGGLYRLKSAGADRLAEAIQEIDRQTPAG
jgi:DNA-binding NarL/FixJ family response regulator